MDASAAATAALLRKSGLEIESEVRGASMHPVLIAGARLRIRCGTPACVPGDIVVFLAHEPMAHRVVGRVRYGSRGYVITRGDACRFCDAPVPEDRILGLVTAYHDGVEWRPPPPFPGDRYLSALLAGVSERAIRVALRVDERLATFVARGGAWIASWCGGRV
jgi:hypothetical protein